MVELIWEPAMQNTLIFQTRCILQSPIKKDYSLKRGTFAGGVANRPDFLFFSYTFTCLCTSGMIDSNFEATRSIYEEPCNNVLFFLALFITEILSSNIRKIQLFPTTRINKKSCQSVAKTITFSRF